MSKSIEEIIAKLNGIKKLEKEKEEKIIQERKDFIESQRKWLEDSRRMYESNSSSAGAGAGAGAGGETISRRLFRNQKYLSSTGIYNNGLTLRLDIDGDIIKVFLPYLGDQNFNKDYNISPSNYQLEYNFISRLWDLKLDGELEGSIDNPFSPDSYLNTLNGTYSFLDGDQSSIVCLTAVEGNLPKGVEQMNLIPSFSVDNPEGPISKYYIGSSLDNGNPETILINMLVADPDNNFGFDNVNPDGWLLVLNGPDGINFTEDDTFAYYPGVGDDFPGSPSGTYSVFFEGSLYGGTYSITLGVC